LAPTTIATGEGLVDSPHMLKLPGFYLGLAINFTASDFRINHIRVGSKLEIIA
jgi:hypothetical protein